MIHKSCLVVDWYPKIQALASVWGQAMLNAAAPNEAWFTPDHLAFLVSNTRLPEISWWGGGMTKEQFEERHVFFQQEDKEMYIEKILRMAVT